MWIPAAHHRLVHKAGAAIFAAFQDYDRQFQAITRRAKPRFEKRDWHGLQHDALERLELYPRIITETVRRIRELLDVAERDKKLWAIMKEDYSDQIRHCAEIELAETFFNSVSRRIFTTIGVDPRIEFLFSDFDAPPAAGGAIDRTYPASQPLPALIKEILEACDFSAPFANIDRDVLRVAEVIDREREARGDRAPIDAIDMIDSVFYRNQGAYLVGRIASGDKFEPLTLALYHQKDGIVVDAVLLTADEVSIIFSFTRSYFHVEVRRPRELVAFLKSIMPRKPIAELYIAIGYNKHGKTELYRDLVRHIEDSTDLFDIAPGDRGMVMSVFTLPSFDVVFKVIRDRFAYPKSMSRRDVMERYQLVFRHDRAGRLADVQEFEHLAFDRRRFALPLLDELAAEAAETVQIGPETVKIRHVYVERRMIPLNLYIREAPLKAAQAAIIDYGQAVRDLAATNIFPGDMLLKNFGVTRHGRVVFYDYDELCPVTECNFREMPAPATEEEEFGAEPWFYVGPRDIFPEEFINFMGLGGELRSAFLQAHAELLTARYWQEIQARHRAGELLDIIPYPSWRRLGHVGAR
ncbi:MAG: bifunctional isocitrate dehydrogenase kinase/phosphatase [Isosphaeraceae bacterium]